MGKELKDWYVEDLAEVTGSLFEKLCKEKNDMNVAVPIYMKSAYREKCDDRHPKYATSFSNEQKDWLEKEYKLKKVKELQYDPILCNWIGEFYTYYQSINKMPSSKIIEQLPFNEMYARSKGLHDLSPQDAVERLNK